jgi:hypothetical protein
VVFVGRHSRRSRQEHRTSSTQSAWSAPLARPDRLTACRHGQPKSPTIIFPADPLIRWDDQKVVNFEQILFANGRMLDLTEAPDQRVRAFNATF